MKALRWIYHRIGQIFCFGVGVALMGHAGEALVEHPWIAWASGAVLVATGLALKALDIWQRAADPGRE